MCRTVGSNNMPKGFIRQRARCTVCRRYLYVVNMVRDNKIRFVLSKKKKFKCWDCETKTRGMYNIRSILYRG